MSVLCNIHEDVVPIQLELVVIISSQAEFLTRNPTDTLYCQYGKYYEMSLKK